MTEQLLHRADVVPVFKQMRREGVSHHMLTRFVIPAGTTARAIAFCTTDSCR